MLSCATLVMACQPVTTIPVATEASTPNLKINDDAPILPSSIEPTVPQAATSPSEVAEPLSTGTVDQNNNQTEIDIAFGTGSNNGETQTNSAQASPDITLKAVNLPKTFNPAKIIGFATQTLFHNLGRAKIIRTEGPIEVWQYQFEGCVVDFFFYPFDEGSSQLILKTWDMRSTIMGNSLNKDDCRNEINLYHQTILSNS